MSKKIVSRHNSKFRLLKKLLSVKGRREESMLIAEGKKFLSLNPKITYSVERAEVNTDYTLSEGLFQEISSLESSEGVISIFDFKLYNLEDISEKAVVLDRVQNPGNLGVIIRNMDAFGFKNLLLINGTCDPFSPRVVRSSMGSVLNVKVIYIDSEDLSSISSNYHLIATHCESGDISVDEIERDRVAVVFGNESRGVSEEILSISKRLHLPISPKVNSLNVAVTSGIVLYLLSRI